MTPELAKSIQKYSIPEGGLLQPPPLVNGVSRKRLSKRRVNDLLLHFNILFLYSSFSYYVFIICLNKTVTVVCLLYYTDPRGGGGGGHRPRDYACTATANKKIKKEYLTSPFTSLIDSEYIIKKHVNPLINIISEIMRNSFVHFSKHISACANEK